MMKNDLIKSLDLDYLKQLAERHNVDVPSVAEVLEEASERGYDLVSLLNCVYATKLAFIIVYLKICSKVLDLKHKKSDDIYEFLAGKLNINAIDSWINTSVEEVINNFSLDSDEEEDKELIEVLEKILT